MSIDFKCKILLKKFAYLLFLLFISFVPDSNAGLVPYPDWCDTPDKRRLYCASIGGIQFVCFDKSGVPNYCCLVPYSNGGGKADPFGPPPSPFIFSDTTFLPGTFTYNNTLIINGTAIYPTLTSFSGVVEFTTTTDPSVMDAKFTSYEFDFEPFLVSGITTPINRQMQISGVGENTGSLNLETGQLNLRTLIGWYDTSDNLVDQQYINYTVTITDTADPNIVDVSFSSYISYCSCPEPETVLLLGAGLALLSVKRRKMLA